ncbi:DNA translocase FtsK [uncultured Azohydromonas sp.]|jgi:DNA segregation ATPase FtsK/SpoIIIE and related proteins|uniref:DNA translocase FtsK n=1 Tax=uncultured Azohydromonas sp. TaxID=487342 RepID=UPI00262C6549|nr:DNA translocase FtsK [uncultured Azohydromonas sp.]
MSFPLGSLNESPSNTYRRRPGVSTETTLPAPPRWRTQLWLTGGAILGLLGLLALITHDAADPGFSTSGDGRPLVNNQVGLLGAWAADLGLFLFGWSVWWLPIIGVRLWLGTLARLLRGESGPPPRRLAFCLGVVLLIAASCALEWTRLYRWESGLPGHAGGVLGYLLGPWSLKWLGFAGSGVAWIVTLVLGLGLSLRFSWVALADRIGGVVEGLAEGVRQGVDGTLDRLAGRRALRQREREGRAARQGQEAHSIRIDPPLQEEPPAAAEEPPPRPARRRAAPVKSVDLVEPVLVDLQDVIEAPTPPAAAPAAEDVVDLAPSAAANVAAAPTAAEPRPPVAVDPPWADTAAGLDLDDAESTPQPPRPAPAKPAVAAPPAAKAPAKPMAVVAPMPRAIVNDDAVLPQVDLLDAPPAQRESVSPETLEMTSRLIEKKLKDFGVEVRVVAASPGPVITRYEIEPATGVKGSQIVNLAKDLSRSLSLVSIRVVETIPGRTTMALELPNARRQMIRLTEILDSRAYREAQSLLSIGLGKDIVGAPVVADLAKMPHCLVAGTTGSGKSVGINAMILSLLYKAEADEVRLILIDPKMLEMSVYEGIPHLLCPVVTDMKQAANALNWCVGEMERRYKLMSKLGVRNLAGYNKKIDEAAEREEHIPNPFSLTPEEPEPLERLPFVVVVIDELADLMMVVGKKIEELIARLAQKARAAGIHLVLATQRPSVDVITGLIKANIPTRLSFQVSSKIDSRTILDQMGAEALLGQGDMLYLTPGGGIPVRVHGAFVSDEEVHRVVDFLKQQGEPNYIEGILEGGVLESDGGNGVTSIGGSVDSDGESDPMYDQAVAIVLQHKRASISLVQRHLRIGYNRAARLLEQMEKSGLVSAMATNGNRDIIVPKREEV